jgi:hypothetical protein
VDLPIEVAPDTVDVPGMRFVYIEHADAARFMGLFSDLVSFIEATLKPLPAGAILTTNTIIRLRSGVAYFGVSVKGELDRWEQGIRAFAESRGLRMGRVTGQAFVSSDGATHPLAACTVQRIDL